MTINKEKFRLEIMLEKVIWFWIVYIFEQKAILIVIWCFWIQLSRWYYDDRFRFYNNLLTK